MISNNPHGVPETSLPQRSDPTSGITVVRFEGVHKNRGCHRALDGMDFEIKQGEILCLLGPNGAGKSTTIQHLLGLLSADSGKVEIFDQAPTFRQVRQRIGCTPQDSGFLEQATVRETLELIAAHYPGPADIDATLDKFGLAELASRHTKALSGGQRRCLSLACAFVGNPDLVLLDEPTTGLDVDVRRRLWQVVRDYAKSGGTVLLTTHYIEEAEALATRVVVINRGRVLKSGDVASIKSAFGVKEVAFCTPEKVNFSSVVKVECQEEHQGNRYRVWTADSDAFIKDLARTHALTDLEIKSITLEEAFLGLLKEVSQ